MPRGAFVEAETFLAQAEESASAVSTAEDGFAYGGDGGSRVAVRKVRALGYCLASSRHHGFRHRVLPGRAPRIGSE